MSTPVAVVSHALHQGKTPADPEWLIAGLLQWGKDSAASSIAGVGELRVRGMVDLRVRLRGLHGRAKIAVFRFRTLRGGGDKPAFLSLGAPALGVPPLGTGASPLPHGHFFPDLDVVVARRKALEAYHKLAPAASVFPGFHCDKVQGLRAVGTPALVAGSRPRPPSRLI